MISYVSLGIWAMHNRKLTKATMRGNHVAEEVCTMSAQHDRKAHALKQTPDALLVPSVPQPMTMVSWGISHEQLTKEEKIQVQLTGVPVHYIQTTLEWMAGTAHLSPRRDSDGWWRQKHPW